MICSVPSRLAAFTPQRPTAPTPSSAAGAGRLHRLVGPEVAAADRRAGDANDRVGRLDQVSVGDVLDTDVDDAVHEGGSHGGTEAVHGGRRPTLLIELLAVPVTGIG